MNGIIRQDKTILIITCIALGILLTAAVYQVCSLFWKEREFKAIKQSEDQMPVSPPLSLILTEDSIEDPILVEEEADQTGFEKKRGADQEETPLNFPALPLEDQNDRVDAEGESLEISGVQAEKEEILNAEVDRGRIGLYEQFHRILSYLFGERPLDQQLMKEHLLEMSGRKAPTIEYLKVQKIVMANFDYPPDLASLTKKEAINFWTIVFLAGLPFFQEFVDEFDQGQINEQEFLGKCLKICLEHIEDHFTAFIKGSNDPQLHLQGQAIFGMLDLFKGTANLDALEKKYGRSLSQLKASNLEAYRQKHRVNFPDLDAALRYGFKEQFLNFLVRRFDECEENDFLKRTQELMIRHSYQGVFNECIIEDITQNLDPGNSLVLELLDLILMDYISSGRKAIWFHGGEQNFGYDRDEEEWKRLLVHNPDEDQIQEIPEGSTFLKEFITTYVDHFEDCLDLFQEFEQKPYPFINDLEYLADNLPTILSLPLNIHQKWGDKLKSPTPFSGEFITLSRIFQRAFLKWSLSELRLEYPDAVNKLKKELPLRILMSDLLIRHADLEILVEDDSRDEIAKELQTLLRRGIEAAKCSSRNLTESRSPNAKKRDLTFGFGFQGTIFHPSTPLNAKDERVFMNLSETGRRLPKKESEKESSLFSIPFLHATRYLIQQINQAHSETGDRREARDLIRTKILNHPLNEDITVHRYLFDRIFLHALTNSEIDVHEGFLPKMKEEIAENLDNFVRMETVRLSNRINPKRKPQNQQLFDQAKAAYEEELQELKKLESQIKEKIRTSERPLFDPKEFQLIHKTLNNKQSICVESVITRHSKNHLIIPFSFNPNRADAVTVDGKKLHIGKHSRPVIPPCDNYCQIFAASHLIWAELTRNTSLDELDSLATEHGQEGVRSQF